MVLQPFMLKLAQMVNKITYLNTYIHTKIIGSYYLIVIMVHSSILL